MDKGTSLQLEQNVKSVSTLLILSTCIQQRVMEKKHVHKLFHGLSMFCFSEQQFNQLWPGHLNNLKEAKIYQIQSHVQHSMYLHTKFNI